MCVCLWPRQVKQVWFPTYLAGTRVCACVRVCPGAAFWMRKGAVGRALNAWFFGEGEGGWVGGRSKERERFQGWRALCVCEACSLLFPSDDARHMRTRLGACRAHSAGRSAAILFIYFVSFGKPT